jgi:hypothetical protein
MNDENVDENKTNFKFHDYGKLIARHERLIKKLEFEDELDDEEIFELAEKVVIHKQKELNRLLTS